MRGKTDRFEYIRQPHILFLLIVVTVIAVGALYTGVRRYNEARRLSSLDTESACIEMIKDDALCKFLAEEENSAQESYTKVTKQANQTITTEFESLDRLKSLTKNGDSVSEEYVILDDTTYVKDLANNEWLYFKDPEFEPSDSSASDIGLDFSSTESPDVTNIQSNYKRLENERCGELECFKYEIQSSEDTETTHYIWFDDQEYRLRRQQTVTGEDISDTEYMYKPVEISTPSPATSVSAEELEALLGDD